MLNLTEEREMFEFELDGKAYSLPSRNSLPLKKYRELFGAINGAEDENAAAFEALLGLFDEYVPEAMERVSVAQALALVKAYAEGGSGAAMGESQASSD